MDCSDSEAVAPGNLEREALDWPRALGSVVGTQTKRSDEGSSWGNWSAELTYSYAVKGEYYSGVHLLPPESEDEATEVASRWRERNLVVRYSPSDISRSVVLVHDQTAGAISALEKSKQDDINPRAPG
jgi:hypothetical protein